MYLLAVNRWLVTLTEDKEYIVKLIVAYQVDKRNGEAM